MSTSAFNEFVLKIPIRSDIPTIYRAWATQSGIENWFLRQAIYTTATGLRRALDEFVQSGDAYAWLWHGYDDSVLEKSTVLEANGRDSFGFGFSGGCRVAVHLKNLPDGQVMCTLHQEMPQKKVADRRHFFIECQKGWTFYLTNLKSVLEGGLDLRNRDETLGVVVSS